MSTEGKKRRAALAALELVETGSIVGVGTGSTTNHFIEALGSIRDRIAAAVPSSRVSAERLERLGIRLVDLNDVDGLPLYVDGADEATRRGELIKGGGGALTREKIIAAAAERFVCIVDESKLVDRLGAFPLPVEVIAMARGYASRQISRLGGRAVWREGFVSDNGNEILDLHGLVLDRPLWLEQELNQIAGVVANGLFCRRPADLVLVGTDDGVTRLERRRGRRSGR